jgi:ketosteroid isomerase-like protein
MVNSLRHVPRLLPGLLLIAACRPAPVDLTTEDRAAIAQVVDDVARTLRAGEFAAWAGLFSEHAVIFPPNAPAVRGRDVIQRWGQGFPPIEELTFFNLELSGRGDVAYATSDYSFTMRGFPPDTGKQLWAFRRSARKTWEVAAASYNSNLPVASQQEPSPPVRKEPM